MLLNLILLYISTLVLQDTVIVKYFLPIVPEPVTHCSINVLGAYIVLLKKRNTYSETQT